ncbi:peroxidase 5-like [Benincasa hispida]|uniref:peroxidase 5-like n=1 Tax=Benincasa hispida TaxID=102211 RepID=UPI0018FF7514|nr:peroxidase 5-like [Benincasa hispida]
MEADQVTTFAAFFIACSLIFSTCSSADENKGRHLHARFYRYSCPQAEKLANDVSRAAFDQDPTLAAALIRLFFHDCFVNGCDASILLDSTISGEPVEKISPANGKTLRGMKLIDEIKARIESECPRIVSCADILAFATRDATVFSGIPYYIIPGGRRDGLSSRAADVFGNLPIPSMPVDEMVEIFTKKGMTADEMVVLIGAHSIGRAQCSFFEDRIYNYSGTESPDPTMDEAYGYYLSVMCPPPNSDTAELAEDQGRRERLVNFDPSSPFKLDNAFYLRLLEGRTLLRSDQDMAEDPMTAEVVRRMAYEPRTWKKSFVRAMVRLSRVDVITGNAGEIRNNCRVVN